MLPEIGITENKTLKETRYYLRYVISISLPIILFGFLEIPQLFFLLSSATLLFILGVVFSSWNGGYKAGIITSIISAGILYYYLTPPPGFGSFPVINGIVTFILFIFLGSFLSYLIDVTHRKSKIEKYKSLLKEFKQKNEELHKQNANLQKEIRSRDEFLSIASHELKTPLTSMLLQTQHALHNIKNVSLAHFSIESLLKMLENVENQTKRLSKMINDFLSISLINTGNMQLEYEELHLNKLVQSIIDEFSPRIQEEKYVVIFEQEDTINGTWDKTRLEQAISNIISNAIKYGSRKPIEVTVRSNASNAQIIVRDHGIGVPKNKQKKMFELFERGVSSDQYKGLGVGLFITKEIITAHQGKIFFSSKPNRGSAITLELPLSPPQNQERVQNALN